MKKIRDTPRLRGNTIFERIYELIVYDEVVKDAYIDILESIGIEYAYAYHDADVKEDGTPKKPHWHILFRYERETSINTVAKTFNIDINMIEWKTDWKLSVQYLIHKNTPNKTQYDISIIGGNIDVQKIVQGEFKRDELIEVKAILYFMSMHDDASLYEILMYCVDNDLYSTFRRGYSMFKDLREESRHFKGEYYIELHSGELDVLAQDSIQNNN